MCLRMFTLDWIKHSYIPFTLDPRGILDILNDLDLAIRSTADVTGGKPIALITNGWTR
jgi:hypothetical protein